jgi:hypothetical protein
VSTSTYLWYCAVLVVPNRISTCHHRRRQKSSLTLAAPDGARAAATRVLRCQYWYFGIRQYWYFGIRSRCCHQSPQVSVLVLWYTLRMHHAKRCAYVTHAPCHTLRMHHATRYAYVTHAATRLLSCQYLYFRTSKASKLSTRQSPCPSRSSSGVSICTFVPEQQVK